jgi:hypothetical protein
MPKLNPRIVWSRVEAATTDHGATEAGTDGDVDQIIDAAPGAERTLTENRHLRIVLKERGKVECCADRTSEIRAWKLGS